MANKPEEFPIFTSLDKKTIQNMLAKMSNYLHNIIECKNCLMFINEYVTLSYAKRKYKTKHH